jgi:hypothetical protein
MLDSDIADPELARPGDGPLQVVEERLVDEDEGVDVGK